MILFALRRIAGLLVTLFAAAAVVFVALTSGTKFTHPAFKSGRDCTR